MSESIISESQWEVLIRKRGEPGKETRELYEYFERGGFRASNEQIKQYFGWKKEKFRCRIASLRAFLKDSKCGYGIPGPKNDAQAAMYPFRRWYKITRSVVETQENMVQKIVRAGAQLNIDADVEILRQAKLTARELEATKSIAVPVLAMQSLVNAAWKEAMAQGIECRDIRSHQLPPTEEELGFAKPQSLSQRDSNWAMETREAVAAAANKFDQLMGEDS